MGEQDGRAAEPPYPVLPPLEVKVGFVLDDWAIVPVGHGHPVPPPGLDLVASGDFFMLSSDGQEVCVEPHYRIGARDDFFVDAAAHVRVIALAGVFPVTLGKQAKLLAGVIALVRAAADWAEHAAPAAAGTILEIVGRLETYQRRSAAGQPSET
jgi:hypothetical protein